MADTVRAHRIQLSHETTAVSYGHFGTATYDEETSTWSFLRQIDIPFRCGSEDEGITEDASPSFQIAYEQVRIFQDKALSQRSVGESAAVAFGRKKAVLKQAPDAAVGTIKLSTLVSDSTSTFEPHLWLQSFGGLLTLDNPRLAAHCAKHSSLRQTPVAALAVGASCETLLLVALNTCNFSVMDYSGLSTPCSIPCIDNRLVGFWINSAERIHRISCSTNTTQRQFLVVKPSGTTILRPILRQAPFTTDMTPQNFKAMTTLASLIDPNPILTIAMSRTGGQPQADAAFNPKSLDSVAVVDTKGQWSIWKLKGKKARSTRICYQAQLLCSSNLHAAAGYPLSGSHGSNLNGWHSIRWLIGTQNKANRVLVCNRRYAAVFDLDGSPLGLIDMRLGLPSERNQILEVQNSNRREDQVIVLTTSRLLIFSSTKVGLKDRDDVEPLVLLCSWNHFRDCSDMTMRINLLEVARGMIYPYL